MSSAKPPRRSSQSPAEGQQSAEITPRARASDPAQIEGFRRRCRREVLVKYGGQEKGQRYLAAGPPNPPEAGRIALGVAHRRGNRLMAEEVLYQPLMFAAIG